MKKRKARRSERLALVKNGGGFSLVLVNLKFGSVGEYCAGPGSSCAYASARWIGISIGIGIQLDTPENSIYSTYVRSVHTVYSIEVREHVHSF